MTESLGRTDFSAILREIEDLRMRVAHLETEAEGGGGGDADTVDGFHASAVPTANYLLALNASAEFPADVVSFGALTLEAQTFVPALWQNQVAWNMAANNNWQQDTQSTTITLRRKSDVVILSDVTWNNSTAARTNGQAFRWTLGGAGVTGSSTGTGNIGNTLSTVEHHFVQELFAAQAAGTYTLRLEAQKTQVAWSGDNVNIYYRIVIPLIIPVD